MQLEFKRIELFSLQAVRGRPHLTSPQISQQNSFTLFHCLLVFRRQIEHIQPSTGNKNQPEVEKAEDARVLDRVRPS